jgi:hypothetical protein
VVVIVVTFAMGVDTPARLTRLRQRHACLRNAR